MKLDRIESEQRKSRKQTEIAYGTSLAVIAINFFYMAGETVDPNFLKLAAIIIGGIACYLYYKMTK